MRFVFVNPIYEIFLFVGAVAGEWCLIIIIAYFGTLYMIKPPVIVITQHATIRSHERSNYS